RLQQGRDLSIVLELRAQRLRGVVRPQIEDRILVYRRSFEARLELRTQRLQSDQLRGLFRVRRPRVRLRLQSLDPPFARFQSDLRESTALFPLQQEVDAQLRVPLLETLRLAQERGARLPSLVRGEEADAVRLGEQARPAAIELLVHAQAGEHVLDRILGPPRPRHQKSDAQEGAGRENPRGCEPIGHVSSASMRPYFSSL